MSWQERKLVTRIFNTFRRLKDKIYTEDIDALKGLNELVEKESKHIAAGNLLYSKLLCVLLHQNLMHFGNMKMAIRRTNDDLNHTLQFHLHMLTKSLNEIDKKNYLESIGVYFNSDNQDYSEIINNNQKEILSAIEKNWKFESVEKSFYSTANDMLKDVNNYA